MNPVKIDNPILQPYRCLFCTSGHKGGPVIDMLVDVLEGRAYICLAHAKRIAIAAGFAEGEELEKLENAAVLLAEAEKGREREREAKEALALTVVEFETRVRELADERDQARQQLAQAEAKLAELGQGIGATLAAVSHSAELTGGPPVEVEPPDYLDPGMLYHADGTPYMHVADYMATGPGLNYARTRSKAPEPTDMDEEPDE